MTQHNNTRVWRGVTTTFAALLAFSLAATSAVSGFRTDIDKFLGTKSSEFVTAAKDPAKTFTYHSDYKDTKQLVQSIRDLGEQMSAEGSVLLKNNGALPLSKDETQKVSLLGFSSYYPAAGGDMGSDAATNTGTDADSVDMVAAFKARGFAINGTLAKMYGALKNDVSTEVNNFGHKSVLTHITAPMIGKPFSSKEPSQNKLDATQPDWKASLNQNNVMVVTLARAAGENRAYLPGKAGVDPKQNLNQTDPLGLSNDERDLVNTAINAKKANGGKVVVLLNNANPMQVKELQDNTGVDAMLQIGMPGSYGFYGVADLLKGSANPSGRLADTWAVNNASAPAVRNYGDLKWKNPNQKHTINSEIVQAEGIYTGYKYYETRYADTVTKSGNADGTAGSTDGNAWNYNNEVLYPFGYGLSYTTFKQKLDSVNVDLKAKTVTSKVTVSNTGKVAGKDVVELYSSAPYTSYDAKHGVEKPAVQLFDYAKTGKIEPGQSQTVTIKSDAQYLASWDSTLRNNSGGYRLDAGDYTFAIGSDAHNATDNMLALTGANTKGDKIQAASWKLSNDDTTTFEKSKNGTVVKNQLQDADLNHWMKGTVTYLTRSDWQGTWPKTYENLTASDAMLKGGLENQTYTIKPNNDAKATKFGASNNMSLANLKGVKNINDPRYKKLMDQITLPEAMIRTAFGGTSTKPITSINSPEVVQNDGPNGFGSYPLGQYANKDKSSGDPYAISKDDKNMKFKMNVMATDSVIGQTFSKDLAKQWGKALGNYSIWANTTLLWGVGTNLHRTPYNARNHEYYSEDPILTAYEGSATVKEALKYGCIIAPKHFAFNDTEINRTGVATFVNEQKAREGELRATQSVVEDAGTLGIMTGFNRVGVQSVNANTPLLINILRNEWGFKGLVSQDFIMDPEYQNLPAFAHNGGTMLTTTGDDNLNAVAKHWPFWTQKNVSSDSTMCADLKRNMTWQNYAYANSNAMDGMNSSSHFVHLRTWYDNVLLAASILTGLLTLLGAVMYVRSSRKAQISNEQSK